MFVRCIHLWVEKQYPLLPNGFYERLAEYYHLPTLNKLLATLHKTVTWSIPEMKVPPNQLGYETYLLQNLREQSKQDYINIYISIENDMIIHVTIQFPVHGDRMNSSRMISDLKSLVNTDKGTNIVIEGYTENNSIRFIRETKLTAFIWIDTLSRYLHITEKPLIERYLAGPEKDTKTSWRSMLIAYL